MFRLTNAVPQPPSSTMFRPSTRTSLLCDGIPLIVIEIADLHCAKSRFRLVSCTPGRIARRPYMSRPFVWMFAISSTVIVDRRELSATCTGVTSEVTETISLTVPTSSVSLPRSRVSDDNRLMSETVTVLKLASSTLSV